LGYELTTYEGAIPPEGLVRYHALLKPATREAEVADPRGP